METILRQINSVAGVMGSLVSDDEGRVLACVFPEAFDIEAVQLAARTAAQTADGLQKARRTKIRQMVASYDEGRFVVLNVREGYLFVLCSPQTNIPLLDLTISGTAARLPELIAQRSAEPVPKVAAPAKDPLDAISDLLGALVEEMGDRGMGREQLLSILSRRLERLQGARPLLSAISVSAGRVDLGALRGRSAGEVAEVVGIVARALCQTCIGMLGQEVTTSKYRQVYDPFRSQNEGVLRSLGLEEILDKVDSLEGAPLAGIDFRL